MNTSNIFLNWLPITFSSPNIPVYYIDGNLRAEGHTLHKGIESINNSESNLCNGLFLLNDEFLTDDHRQVDVVLNSFKNTGLIKHIINFTLQNYFSKNDTLIKTEIGKVSVVLPKSKKNLTPEFSICDCFDFSPYYVIDPRDNKIVYGIVTDFKLHYSFNVPHNDLHLFINHQVTNGTLVGKLKGICNNKATIEVRERFEKFKYTILEKQVDTDDIKPVGSVVNLNSYLSKKYTSSDCDRIDFERRKASLSVTSNGSINQNILRDKLAKIISFVKSTFSENNKLSLYNKDESVRFKISSEFLKVSHQKEDILHIKGKRLEHRIFSFSHSDTQDTIQSYGQFQGIQRCGPIEKIQNTNSIRYLFIYEEHKRDTANKLFFALKNGIGSFPGVESLFGMPINNENVIGIKITNSNRYSLDQSYTKCIESFFKEKNLPNSKHIYLAYILSPSMPQGIHPNPYHASKALLLSHGIPSQGIDYETVDNSNFRWSMSNIALASFAKLGGIPWRMWNNNEAKQLIFGIGQKQFYDHSTNEIKRIIGFTVCVTPDGRFQSVTTFKPFTSRYDFISHLKEELVHAIKAGIETQGNVEELIIHYPKPSSQEEIKEIEEALNVVSSTSSKIIPYAIVRVSESKGMYLFDSNHETRLPEEGNVARLSPIEAILCVPGRQDKKSIHSIPKYPLRIRLEHSTLTSTKFDQLLYQVYSLAGANWRGFNAREMPITLFYSELIADIITDLEHYEYDFLSGISKIDRTPWFL